MRKYRNIKLVTSEERKNYLVSEPNYHRTKCFLCKFISHRNLKKNNTNIYEYTSLFRSINIRNN